MREDYIKQAQQAVPNVNILINLVSRRVKQLRCGSKPLIDSLEHLEPEDVALREIIEGRVSYELYEADKKNGADQYSLFEF
ncbi:MAG: DNA-directed RNA polymerase subunit omega [Puniceicoccales bacterium]|jgi:DNA-directed RNA polymerase subunit omega|nr:DNA-directed RNA polymerase subunit omega [Puniceicoccales bacterium]